MKLWKSLKVTIGTKGPETTSKLQDGSAWCTQDHELDVFKSQTSLSTDSGLCTNERGLWRTHVELRKPSDRKIGIVLASRSEPGLPPSITGFTDDSVALESDRFAVGDRICGINGISTTRLTNEEIIRLLENVEGRAELDLQYSMPNYSSQNSLYITTKLAEVPVEKINGSLGITIRGGVPEHPMNGDQGRGSLDPHPLIITHVRPGGAAYSSSRIKPGDRLLKVDHISLTNKTLSEVHQILQNCPMITSLTIEYDVSIMDSVKHATGPLLIEIERPCNEDLGLFLTNQRYSEDCYSSGSETYQRVGHCNNAVYIDSILPASISDRCGALHPGDQILAFDDLVIENNNYSAEEVMCYLENVSAKGYTQLHVVPRHILLNGRFSRENSISCASTLNTRRTKQRNLRQCSVPKLSLQEDYDCTQNYVSTVGVCRTEQVTVQLEIPPSQDSGISVYDDNELLLVAHITHQSPAYRTGCIQTGDRVVSINGHENLTQDIANDILQRRNDAHIPKYINVKIEFSMADTVEASSGIFSVKLAKNSAGLGVTITGCKSTEGPMVISEVRAGSAAHRCGALQPGDQLLAINNQPLHQLSLDTAFNILQNSPDDIITLKIRKVENNEDWSAVPTPSVKSPLKTVETVALVHNSVPDETKINTKDNINSNTCVFLVEIIKQDNGALGLTLAGSEDPSQPIVVSGLIEGGVAEKCNKLRIGDEILSINGESVLPKPLSEAIKLLTESDQQVVLKVSRKITDPSMCVDSCGGRDSNLCSNHSNSSPGLSNDSAVESWDQNSPTRNSALLGNEIIEYAVPDKLRISEKTQHYSPAHDNKLISNYGTSTFNPPDLPLPNYSLNNSNSLKTFHYENTCIIPDNALKNKSNTREEDVNQIEILTNRMRDCKLHPDKINCKCDYVSMSPYSPKHYNSRRNWDDEPYPPNEGIYTLTSPSKSPSKPSTSFNPYGSPIYEGETSALYSHESTSTVRGTIHNVILYKDAIYDDYGFSISDGLYERGVYINRIRRGGPADIVGLLKPFDRIMQVNGTRTVDYDCCLTVPLIASSPDRLELVVQRLNGAVIRMVESPDSHVDDHIVTTTI